MIQWVGTQVHKYKLRASQWMFNSSITLSEWTFREVRSTISISKLVTKAFRFWNGVLVKLQVHRDLPLLGYTHKCFCINQCHLVKEVGHCSMLIIMGLVHLSISSLHRLVEKQNYNPMVNDVSLFPFILIKIKGQIIIFIVCCVVK